MFLYGLLDQSFNIIKLLFMMLNFSFCRETGETWADEVRDDVIEECAKNGGKSFSAFSLIIFT